MHSVVLARRSQAKKTKNAIRSKYPERCVAFTHAAISLIAPVCDADGYTL